MRLPSVGEDRYVRLTHGGQATIAHSGAIYFSGHSPLENDSMILPGIR